MKVQTILFVGMIVKLCLVPSLEAKRSFGITRSRNKNKGPSVRRNQHGHEFDDNPVPPAHPKPSAPELRKPMPNTHAPSGPPSYPVHGQAPMGAYGAPPAYSPSYASPPGYSTHYNQPRPGMYQPGAYNQPGGFGHQGSYNQPSYGGVMPMGGMPMGGGMMGGGMMGGGMMGGGMMGGGYGQRSGMGSGIMTNLFAGLAGYQLARAIGGGSRYGGNHGQSDREVIIINNQQPAAAAADPAVPVPNTDQIPLNPVPDAQPQNPYAPEAQPPQTETAPVGPADNEYNYWGNPQYGIPLYGYSMPSQITDYLSTAIVTMPQQPAPINEK